ncbi:iron complex transport system substrate-binding protein [Oikeobacillus pervagus]|uniref:Iron complex transport system substrate-binding protein n=1 Tax=Oikeobacillus pervagus TaxID=1325931 RepID=A0AAJ1SWL7_9BACI|nr:ABC transporter substrate-binding protein [Oikeobacillus pervagus]MDQ0213979.1 iron complex transport system substrate-binding protein [Oikeobacillus pervagus]
MKKNVFFILIALILLLASCGSLKEEGKTKEANNKEIVTIQNLDHELKITEPPKRAVSLNQHVTEIMLALGLEDSMVGTAYLDDQILPEYEEAYKNIPVLSKKYPSYEVLIASEPDFVYGGWKSAFTEKGVGTIEQLKKDGINAYLHESSNKVAPTMEDVFQDIYNIGKIFGVEDRAEKLTNKIEKEMNEIEAKIGEVKDPIPVFIYDSGEKEPFTAAQNFMNDLITRAGGENIFGNIEKGWTSASWEEVVKRNPEVIVIMDYGEETVEQKKKFLENHPILQAVKAVKEKRFVVLPLSAGSEGVRSTIALKTLAEGFYPEKFLE